MSLFTSRHRLLACATLFWHALSFSQNTEILNAYDQSAGLENLNLNNGRAYDNPYRVRNGNHQFLATSDYTEGIVLYDGQQYADVSLRYDIYHDILMFRPKNLSNNIGTVLEKDRVASFTINSKNFVNLNDITSKPDFVSGYYETCFEGKNATLLAKHHKFRKEKHGEGVTYEEFSDDPNFILSKGGSFFKVNSKSEITAIFPEQKDRIRDFYQKERDLEKKDKIKFMTNLLRFIDNYSNP